MKKLVSIALLIVFLIACTAPAQQSDAPAADATVEPAPVSAPEDDPVFIAPTEVPPTLPPVPTPTPTPSPTPEPTPVPTPTPIPYDAEAEARIRSALSFDADTFTTVSTRGAVPSLLKEPDTASERIVPFSRVEGVYVHEWIVLDTVETEQRTYLHLRPIGAEGDGYIDVRNVQETKLAAPESTFALLVRPRGIIYSARTDKSSIAAHASYEVVRVIGIDVDKGYAAVLTSDGKTGYSDLGQLRFISREDSLTHLHQSCERPESTFSDETLVDDAYALIGESYQNSAEFLFDLLRSEGLHFNETYYLTYVKPLDDEQLYPKHLYISPVYNTLLFKLFNTAGDLVTCDGAETEWAYIGDYESIEAGDLLFFSDTDGKGDAIVPNAEVVVHGKYSGDVTDCGLYLGEGRMLAVKNGLVADVAIDPIMEKTFDCARRIHPYVIDEKAHFIECMISMIYDRLGTPYNSIRRVGDASYDCSGIICWVFRSYDFERTDRRNEPVLDLTAQEWGSVKELKNSASRITFTDTGITRETLGDFERGDLILLVNESRSKIGHVMVYLGNNTVIHSTTIDSRYRGTLVAQFRPHLQALYYCSQRIDSVTPID